MLKFAFGGLIFVGDALASVYLTGADMSRELVGIAILAAMVGIAPEVYRFTDRLIQGESPEE